ncbi:MAG: hypothetical protein K8R21_06690, partial [Leptospira sp.]|nr:hypothetical protein [Leptospira sp.]
MINHNHVSFLSIIFFLCSLNISAESKDEYIAWTPVPDAEGYFVEIRDQLKKTKILEKKTKLNILEVDLPRGKYEVRSTALNVFGKPAVVSAWEPIKVIISIFPKLPEILPPVYATQGKDNFTLTLQGDYFLEAIHAYLRSGPEKIPVKSVTVSDEGKKIEITMDLKNVKPGSYDLTLANPRKKSITKKEFFVITENGAKFAEGDYQKFIENMKHSCKITTLPDPIVHTCFNEYIYLDLSTEEKVSIYSFIRMTSDNYKQR